MQNINKPLQFNLENHINYQEGSVVSREVFKNTNGTITLFAFSEGQGLSEHKTPYDAMVYIVDGEAQITIAEVKHHLKKGEMIHMLANHPHAVFAPKPFKMLLVMIKS